MIHLVVERLTAWGHPNVVATHQATLEFTKENNLTSRGDCVIAVNADRGLSELSIGFKRSLRAKGSVVEVILQVGHMREVLNGCGSQDLILSHPTDFVIRKSSYICPRTLMIMADKAACDLSRSFVKMLQKPQAKCEITIKAQSRRAVTQDIPQGDKGHLEFLREGF